MTHEELRGFLEGYQSLCLDSEGDVDTLSEALLAFIRQRGADNNLYALRTHGYLTEDDRVGRHAYEEALNVQSACNSSGVISAWARCSAAIFRESHIHGHGTDWRNQHPIMVLFSSKMESLCRGYAPESFPEAYRAVCKELGR